MRKNIKVYIAAPFFNADQIRVVKNIEQTLKNEVKYYSPRSEGIIKNMSDEEKKDRVEYIYKTNVEGIENCTHVVAFIDNYDPGTVWEMGYATALGKKIVTYTDKSYRINVMLNESIYAHCLNLSEIIPAIIGEFKGDKSEEVI